MKKQSVQIWVSSLLLILFSACDRATKSNVDNAPPTPPVSNAEPAKVIAASEDDIVSEFEQFAQNTVAAINKHADENAKANKSFIGTSLATTSVDVRKTDSLVSPVLGILSIKKADVLMNYNLTSKSYDCSGDFNVQLTFARHKGKWDLTNVASAPITSPTGEISEIDVKYLLLEAVGN